MPSTTLWHRARSRRSPSRVIAPAVACILISLDGLTAAVAQPTPGTAVESRPGDLGSAGLVVNDELGYGDGRAAQGTVALVHGQLKESGRFADIVLHRFDMPQQVIVRIAKAVKGSQDVADAKLLAGAATLFLIPTQQSYDYLVDISIECRGRETGHWKYLESITQTQFIFADPHAGVAKVIKASLGAFASEARATGSLGQNCR